MHDMPPPPQKVPKQTKAPHRKSRQGCRRCKTLRTKCDEKKPACSRCEARGVPCSGYGVNIRWSYKHEVQQQNRGEDSHRDSPAAAVNNCHSNPVPEPESVAPDPQVSVTVTSAYDPEGGNDALDTIFLENHPSESMFGQWSLSQHLGASFLENSMNSYDPEDSAFNILPLLNEEPDWNSLLAPPPSRVHEIIESPDHTTDGFGVCNGGLGDSGSVDDLNQDQAVGIPESRRLRDISDVASSLANYFFQDVISRYCTWDSNSNIMRIIIQAMWQSSGALYHTIQSMAAACLSNELPQFSKVAQQERRLALELVQDTPLREDRLLAAFLLGHTSCWVNPTDLVPNQFKQLWMTLASYNSPAGTTLTISFVQEAMEYWTMILSFITDTEQLGDLGLGMPPVAGPLPLNSLITPNPFSGVSRAAVSIFTDTGRLIYKLRKRLPKLRFIRETDVKFLRDTLEEASRLERRILSYCPLDASKIVVLGDPQTTPEHFQKLEEAFWYTSLLQLYRVFPDLLHRRYRPWNAQEILLPQAASCEPNQDEMDEWLTKLALHILKLLESIPADSRTRSIQPPIIVALSSELQYKHNVDGKIQDSASKADDIESMSFPAIGHSIDVARARRFAMLRLSTYWHVLPLRKIKKYQMLVKHVWDALDAGVPDVYWADMLCDEQFRTIMG